MADLIALNATGGCYSQDKLFTNFTYTPGTSNPDASSVNASLAFQAGVNDEHGWTFSAQWANPFSVGFDITVCTDAAQGCGVVAPFQRIFAVQDQQNSGFTPNAATVAFQNNVLVGPAANLPLNTSGASLAALTAQGTFSSPVSSVQTLATGTPNGAPITQVTLKFYQLDTSVPEPASLSLIGLGLVGLGLLARRKRVLG